jgi:hypothetical protein
LGWFGISGEHLWIWRVTWVAEQSLASQKGITLCVWADCFYLARPTAIMASKLSRVARTFLQSDRAECVCVCEHDPGRKTKLGSFRKVNVHVLKVRGRNIFHARDSVAVERISGNTCRI